jgi:hypothetical protein
VRIDLVARELIGKTGKIARARDQLLVFCLFPDDVEPTNVRASLRSAVIQRKVTNGNRTMWAAEYETAVRSAVNATRLARRVFPDHLPNHSLIAPPRRYANRYLKTELVHQACHPTRNAARHDLQ